MFNRAREPNLSGTPDSPEHHQEVTWEVSVRNGGTEITISERHLPSDDAKDASDQARSMVLDNLKQMLEGDRR